MIQDKKETAIYVAYDDWKHIDPAGPEKKLLQAILMNAMEDLKRQDFVGRQARRFFLEGSDEYVFSFKSICNFLEIDENSILQYAGLEEENHISV